MLAHPLCAAILTALEKGTATVSEVADRIGEAPNKTHYHMAKLEKYGCVEIVSERRGRGNTVARVYRRTTRVQISSPDWEKLPLAARAAFTQRILSFMADDLKASLTAGVFEDRPDRHISRRPLQLDERGWADVAELLDQTLARANEIEAESVARNVASDSPPPISAYLHMTFFESPSA